MSMKGRTWQSEKYRYGFNGKENDSDWEVQDYGFRIYKPELGKFLSVDPLTQSYPWYTPYQFAGNQPIWAIDLDGLEEKIVINSRKITNEFHQIKNSKGVEEALSWLTAHYLDEGWKNKKDITWLQDKRGKTVYNHPVRINDRQIPDRVVEAFNTEERNKGIEIYGLMDIGKDKDAEKVAYYKVSTIEPKMFKRTGDKIGEGYVLLNNEGGGSNGGGYESNTTADKTTVINNPTETGDIYKFLEKMGIIQYFNKRDNPDGKEHSRDTTGWRGDGIPDTANSYQYLDGTVQWNKPKKTVVADPKPQKKGNN